MNSNFNIQENTILFFDGVCNLCNASVVWILKNESNAKVYFSPLQGEIAQELLGDLAEDLQSLVLSENGLIYTKSTAALRIVKYLKWYYQPLRIFFIVPKFLRNPIYSYIAKNRYKWFGRQEACMVPSVKLSARFI
jgi:predicted DCC family thiol-disulfide oxidoreductase YuxK